MCAAAAAPRYAVGDLQRHAGRGTAFFSTVEPSALGHKALAVNLSDLAACGAAPLAFTLALALPSVNEVWLGAFSRGLLALADEHGCELIGGDTTRGPLTICITVFGEVPLQDGRSQALLRSGARAGDDLYASGMFGDAALALDVLRGRLGVPAAVLAAARLRLERPSPRVALGQALRGIASAAIDVSDGLLGDLGHILKQSGVGATVAADTAAGLVAARAFMPARRAHLTRRRAKTIGAAGRLPGAMTTSCSLQRHCPNVARWRRRPRPAAPP